MLTALPEKCQSYTFILTFTHSLCEIHLGRSARASVPGEMSGLITTRVSGFL